MEIKFRLTRKDLSHMQDYLLHRGDRRKIMMWWVGIVVVVLLMAAFMVVTVLHEIHKPNAAANGKLWALSAGFTAIVVGVMLVQKAIASRRHRREHPEEPEHTVRLAQEALVHSLADSHSTIPWTAITELGQDDHSIYLFTGPEMAHLIPKRAFSNPEQASEFFNLASRFRGEAEYDAASPALRSPDTVSLTYRISRADAVHAHYSLFWRFRKLSLFGSVLGILAATVLIVSQFMLILSMSPAKIPSHLTMIAPSFLMPVVIYFLFLSPRRTIAGLGGKAALADFFTINMRRDGLQTVNIQGTMNIAWSVITDVVKDNRLIYFMSADWSILFLPLAQFPNPEDAARYLETANALRRGELDADVPWNSVEAGTWPPPPAATR